MLSLDWTKASQHLGWQPVLSLSQALDMTLDWYRDVKSGENAQQKCLAQIDAIGRNWRSKCLSLHMQGR